ncbi:hypothetical protein ACIPYV_12740, partial [Paenarthrobacter nicotinovorans]|uniref:hypothetical protein n=1 Tax=Paenarthrobacter nicotinovorans TaxID=29320 RepID=UPI00380FA787
MSALAGGEARSAELGCKDEVVDDQALPKPAADDAWPSPEVEAVPGDETIEPVTRSDASCCLLFQGGDGASSGVYRPRGYELNLSGSDIAQHHVTNLHEMHHKVLNDDTSWGALIHFAARHPGWDGKLLEQLVGSCTVVHEAFASFMATSLARQRHQNVDEVLIAYPIYRPLLRRMERLLAPVPGGHRRELAATAVARFCMNSPVLTLIRDTYPRLVALADFPSSWLPDQRFSLFGGVRQATIRDAVSAADDEFTRTHGQPFEALTLDETDDRLEAAWEAWEAAFIDSVVSSNPRLTGLSRVPADDHRVSGAELDHAATSHGIPMSLTDMSGKEALSDAASVQRILSATELRLREEPWRSALAEIGSDVDRADVLGLSAAGPVPFLLVQGRTPVQLSGAFTF